MRYSFVVPVYNGEKTIGACLDSILRQKQQSFEVLVVNDGSTDGTGAILAQYAADARVRVLTQSNAGAAAARYAGIREAEGDYILFADSDDTVSPRMLEVLDENIAEADDLIRFSYVSVNDRGVCDTLHCPDAVYDRETYLREIFVRTMENGTEAVVLWNQAYRRTLAQQVPQDFRESFLEDYVFNVRFAEYVRQARSLSEPLYRYRVSDGSLSHRFNPRGLEILRQAERIKAETMARLGLTSPAHLQNAAKWYVHYAYAYGENACFHGNLTRKQIAALWRDPVLAEKARSIPAHERRAYERWLAKKRYGALALRLWVRKRLFLTKAMCKKLLQKGGIL